MTLTEAERQRAMQLYMNRQACNNKYNEKRKAQATNEESSDTPTKKMGRKIQQPTEEQLEKILVKTKEKTRKKTKLLYPQTKEDILEAIVRLQRKLEQVLRREMSENNRKPQIDDDLEELMSLIIPSLRTASSSKTQAV